MLQFTQADLAFIDRSALHDEHVTDWMWDTSEWVDDHRDRNILRWDEEYPSRDCDQMEYDKRDHQAHVAAYDQDEWDRYNEHAMNDHAAHVQARFDHQYGIDDDIPF